MEWFRLWHDFFHDAKLKRLTKSQRYDVSHLLELASENEPRGQIDLDDEDIASALDMEDAEFSVLIDFLTRKEVLDRNGGGRLRFMNWEKRQPKSDNVSARVAKFRERTRHNDVTSAVTECNVSETHRTEHSITENNRGEERREGGNAPTLDQIVEFTLKCGGTKAQGEKCFWHYEAKGWPSNGFGVRWDALVKKWLLTDADKQMDGVPVRNSTSTYKSGFEAHFNQSMLDYGNKHGLSKEQMEKLDWAPLIKSGEVKVR